MARRQSYADIDETQVRELEDWLHERRLSRYAPMMRQHEVFSLDELAMLTSDDLTQMGITAIGSRRKLMSLALQLRGTDYVAETMAVVEPVLNVEAQGDVKVDGKTSNDCEPKTAGECIAGLEQESDILQSINEAAAVLLKFEKEDSVANEHYIPGRFENHGMKIDLGPIRQRMQWRISQLHRSRTPLDTTRQIQAHQDLLLSPQGKKKTFDYRKLIDEQAVRLTELDVVHNRYKQLLTACLEAVAIEVEKHSRVGEYRDASEYRLKMKLGKLIGIPNPDAEEHEDDYHAKLGVTEATLKRREVLQKHFEELVMSIDKDGNGLLDNEEMHEAFMNNEDFRKQMEVMAFNLALDPENRFISDHPELNQEIQLAVEDLVARADRNNDGLISPDEISVMSPKSRRVLNKLGLPTVLGRAASYGI